MARVLKKNKNELLEVLEDYMTDCKYRDLRRTTIRAYEQSLRLLFKFLEDDYGIIYVEDVKEEYIRNYIDFTKERGKYSYVSNDNKITSNVPQNRGDFGKKVSLCTLDNYIGNIKMFFTWCKDNKLISKDPSLKIKRIKYSRKPKAEITVDEFNKLLRSLDLTLFSEYRDYIIIQLLMDTGMRVGECLELRENDVDIRNKTIFISGEIAKGRKDRYVDSEYMFATNRGTKYQIHSFEKHIRNYIKRIKIDKQITPHTLRNNFAKRFLMGGGDIYTLSKLLGHSSIRVTEQAYLDLTTTDIRKNYLKFSPLENMSKKK
ncbi:tyrosine-type recombinase/integrase [Clostridium perfringens]|uniref:tyrosine-type recombinase/integrase n=1 Tax=Clostridium perfringens TaxID=1502 RepID=UPI00123FB2C5|nr:tyrosine-type recombinase/integrase [Clostridium perfringens]EHK2355376.1 tyrosine-type recombinase/integrase [Clostridium perfringens]MCX0416317.1 tyrosine-type recombinase/integrase [Clostridium perfringens]